MARILRGEIRWADLNPVRGREQAGRRPVLVVSHDVFNERSGTVIAVAMTSQEPRAGFPLALESTAAGLPKSYVERLSTITNMNEDKTGSAQGRYQDLRLDGCDGSVHARARVADGARAARARGRSAWPLRAGPRWRCRSIPAR